MHPCCPRNASLPSDSHVLRSQSGMMPSSPRPRPHERRPRSHAHHTSLRPLVHALREALCAHACSDSSEQCEGAAHVRVSVQLLVEIANTWTDDVTDAVSTARTRVDHAPLATPELVSLLPLAIAAMSTTHDETRRNASTAFARLLHLATVHCDAIDEFLRKAELGTADALDIPTRTCARLIVDMLSGSAPPPLALPAALSERLDQAGTPLRAYQARQT